MKNSLPLFPHIGFQEALQALHPPNPNSQFKGKVFCIGFNKTGTSTISEALKILGFKSHRWHHPNDYYTYFVSDGYSYLAPWFEYYNFPFLVAADDISWLFHNEHMFSRIKHVSQHASSFGDYPWSFFYRIFNEWFPGSKFILTLRNSTYDLVNSSVRMALRIQWKQFNELRESDYKQKVYGVPLMEYIMLTARAYERHNQNVLNYFHSNSKLKNQLLILNLNEEKEKPWRKLCEFLDCPLPSMEFPIKNEAPTQQANHVLPTQFDLNWKKYCFEDKYQRIFDLVKAIRTNKSCSSEEWGLLRSYYGPIKEVE